DTVCTDDFFWRHVYRNGKKTDQTAVLDIDNEGLCQLTVNLPDRKLNVASQSQHTETTTIPPGKEISARCDGDTKAKCKWRIRITLSLAAKAVVNKPAAGATYRQGKVVPAKYSCKNAVSCTGPVPSGSAIDTSTVGRHEFVVTARNELGFSTTTVVDYT